MSGEELLKPRYKVIADFPLRAVGIGEVLAPYIGSNNLCVVEGGFWITDLSKYPHLFKPLAWWEERDLDDLPQFVKRDSGVVVKLDRQYFTPRTIQEGFAHLYERDEQGIKNFIWLKSTTPATETEYQNYINQKG